MNPRNLWVRYKEKIPTSESWQELECISTRDCCAENPSTGFLEESAQQFNNCMGCPWGFPGKNSGVGCPALSRRSSQPRDRTGILCVSCVGRQILYP